MPLSDTIQQLDARLRATVEKTVAGLRQEFLERLQTHHEQLREHLEGRTSDLSDSLLPAEELDAVVRELAAAAAAEAGERERGDALKGLKTALARLDGAQSQAETLAVLLAEAGRFASRAAVLLAAPGGLRGWGGHGFGEAERALRGFEMAAGEGSGVAELLEGRGTVEVGSAGRARLSSRLEVPLARQAVLIPLVLRDRIAAALYADRLDEETPLAVDALQILTHVAAASLETLPLRQRSFNPTLRSSDEIAPDSPGLPVWEATTVVAEAVEEIEDEELDLEDTAALAEEEGIEEDSQEEPGAEGTAVDDGLETSGERLSWRLDEEPEEPEDTAEPGAEAVAVLAEEEGGDAEPQPEPAGEPLRTLRIAPPQAPPAPPPAASSVEEGTHPGVETVEGDSAPVTMRPGPAGALVEPPSDVDGPGWAFTANEDRASGEEADHQKAQRLARLLVSEIKLYNEEQIQEGRRNHDICERLKEDLERSRQLYESRVDERVRESTDYFYQEMVRVLGAGDPKTLGI